MKKYLRCSAGVYGLEVKEECPLNSASTCLEATFSALFFIHHIIHFQVETKYLIKRLIIATTEYVADKRIE